MTVIRQAFSVDRPGSRYTSPMKTCVLTGGPSVGKTTVVEILASRGYGIVPEAARLIAEEECIKGTGISPARSIQTFQQYVAERQLKLESEARGELVFLDRGIVDGYAYCTFAKVPVPRQILDAGRGRYDRVFLLDSLGKYVEDGVRSRATEDPDRIHELIQEAYRTFGYDLIRVPVLPPEGRVDFIVNLLQF